MDIKTEFYQNYQYSILVIDDDPVVDQKGIFEYISEQIYQRYKMNLTFHYISEIENTQNIFKRPYDVIMFDQMLDESHGAIAGINTKLGIDCIKEFRRINQKCKVIFYSSHIQSNEETNNYNLDIRPDLSDLEAEGFPIDQATRRSMSDKIILDLINKYNVNKIIPRDEEVMIEALVDCCRDTDMLVMMLYRSIYDTKDTSYIAEYTVGDRQLSPDELLSEILKDSDTGRTFISSMFDFFSAQYLTLRMKP